MIRFIVTGVCHKDRLKAMKDLRKILNLCPKTAKAILDMEDKCVFDGTNEVVSDLLNHDFKLEMWREEVPADWSYTYPYPVSTWGVPMGSCVYNEESIYTPCHPPGQVQVQRQVHNECNK